MICSKCYKSLPKSEFHRDKRLPSGHRRECKMCIKKRRIKHRKFDVSAWVKKYHNADNALAIGKEIAMAYVNEKQDEARLGYCKRVKTIMECREDA